MAAYGEPFRTDGGRLCYRRTNKALTRAREGGRRDMFRMPEKHEHRSSSLFYSQRRRESSRRFLLLFSTWSQDGHTGHAILSLCHFLCCGISPSTGSLLSSLLTMYRSPCSRYFCSTVCSRRHRPGGDMHWRSMRAGTSILFWELPWPSIWRQSFCTTDSMYLEIPWTRTSEEDYEEKAIRKTRTQPSHHHAFG